MEKECRERLDDIASKFKTCRKAISAIGDETRQLILLALLDSILMKMTLEKRSKSKKGIWL